MTGTGRNAEPAATLDCRTAGAVVRVALGLRGEEGATDQNPT